MIKNSIQKLCLIFLISAASICQAGNQKEEQLSNSVKALMQKSISDLGAPKMMFASDTEGQVWLSEMSERLKKRLPDQAYREDFLRSVYYEATRAGLDPQMVLGLIQVESAFKKYAVSSVGARGYMQVMPFWVKTIGATDHNLFHLKLNLRYGCTILRHYLDKENGDLYRALGRYNGSLGKPQYPNLVLGAWRKNWDYSYKNNQVALN
jgi:soluble lytic murein transglycosylase-like protein